MHFGLGGFPCFFDYNDVNFNAQLNLLNPNKTGLFEGSFFGGRGQFDPPLSYFKEELI